jgi:hypothetical protein
VFFPVDIWFRAFVLTLAVELPIGAVLLRRFEPAWPRLLVLILFANLASHPAVWFIFTQLFLVGTPEYVVAAEGWAIGIEALFYWAVFRGLSPGRALLVSLAANAASFLLGRLLLTLWPDLLL